MFTNIAQNRYEPDQGYRQLSQIALPPELISESGASVYVCFDIKNSKLAMCNSKPMLLRHESVMNSRKYISTAGNIMTEHGKIVTKIKAHPREKHADTLVSE